MRNKVFPFQSGEVSDICVFCFHHAGGAASAYKKWTSYSRSMTVLPVEIPGNGSRMAEEFQFDLNQMARDFAREIYAEAADKKIYLFGHSMGAAMAFFVCYELETTYNKRVEVVVVAGRHAPNEVIKERYYSDMGLDALEVELRKLGETPEEVFADKDIRDFLLGKVQNAYRLHESVKYHGEKIQAPIIAHYGNCDEDATNVMMEKWRKLTYGEFLIREFEGSHFFPLDMGRDYFDQMLQDMHAFDIVQIGA